MTKKNLFKSIMAATLAVVMCLSVVGCGLFGPSTEPADTYTYRTYTTTSPSNWNELTYQDNNDTQIMGYLGSSFYSYDFKFDENGKIVPGEFVMKYEAATSLVDSTAKYAEAWGLPADGKGYAYTITLREDLKWNDGTPIKAEDFVYTMSEQLNPLFQNYRADSFYAGSTIIKNAQTYLKQGQTLDAVNNCDWNAFVLADLVKGDNGVYTRADGGDIYFSISEKFSYSSGYSAAQLVAMGYLDATAMEGLKELADQNGKVAITDESIELWKTLINTPAWGNEDETFLPYYWVIPNFVIPATDFSEVGLFVGDTDYELVMVLEKPLDLLKEDGSLSYKAAYNLSSLPLVKKDLYEANKVAPSEGSTLWTSTYHSSLESTASWGPYMLTSFQSGKQYTLEKNPNWYGYGLEENKDLYQTTHIVCDTIKEWASAWTAFKAGQIDGIGIDVSIADEYKHSDRAYFTPDDYVGSLQLQSNKDALKSREEAGVNKTLLTYADFRKALSLSINRAEYTAACTTSSLAGYGLFNSMHYYDVENGGVYRNTDEAKKVLCEVYSVDYTKYESLDAAVDAITGYNLEEARKLVDKTYDEAVKAGDIKEGDKFVVTFGSSEINEPFMRHVNFIANSWTEMFKGTKLEGKFEFNTKAFSDAWANDFRAGAYDVTLGGWTGAAWDPAWFLTAYLSDQYRYAKAWDTSKHMMTFTMKGVGENGEDITETMSLIDWYNCLNSNSGAQYKWGAGDLEESKRLQLIAAIEGEILKTYYSVPVSYSFAASMLSYKVDYITYEYNTFMGYGGMKYMKYNFNDAAWAAEVAANNGELDYK